MVKERHKETPAAYVVLKRDEKILLQRRFNTGYMDGKYSLPAGHVDKGETFTQCAIREAKEEIGVDLEPGNVRFAHMMHRFSGIEWKDAGYRIDTFFLVETWNNVPEIREPDKCDDLSWFDLNNLPDDTIPYIRQALDPINKKVFYSEFGWEV